MKKEFHMIQGTAQTEKDVQRFLERMSIATGQGFRVESCGIQGIGGFYAIMSKPEGAKLRSFGALSAKEMDLVRTLAECDMVASAAARELGWNRTTIQNYCDRVYAKTGLNPLCFYDLNELLNMEVQEDGKASTNEG